MKRNIILFAILVVLLVVAYIAEEIIGNNKDDPSKLALLDVKSLGELTGFIVNNANVKIKADRMQFVEKELPVSVTKVNDFLQSLSTLHVTKKIDLPKDVITESYLGSTPKKLEFLFEKNSMIFWLGKQLNFSREFYVGVERDSKFDIFVVEDKEIAEGFYSEEDKHRASNNYYKVAQLFGANQESFIDKGILASFHDKIVKLKFTNGKNRDFELNVDKKQTLPTPPPGILYDENFMNSFINDLSKLQSDNVFAPIKKENLQNIIRTVIINDSLVMNIYERYGSLTGYFVYLDGSNTIYELNAATVKYLFVNFQEFWNLYLPLNKFEYGKEDQKFEISFSPFSKSHKCLVEKGNKFVVKCDSSIDQANIFALFQKMAQKAYMVSTDVVLQDSMARIKITSKEVSFTIYEKDGEVLITTMNNKNVFHFSDFYPVMWNESAYFSEKQ